ncbi:MAG: septal ring lytic transglycosylase RlpA family lipoprotein [Thalassobius sp.]|nr:septal ring lytic transglycosylase RlpA family lipoprotein [Thalassovita sp.]
MKNQLKAVYLFLIIVLFQSCSLDELFDSEDVSPEAEELENKTFEQEGIASYYADKFDGNTTASGEIFRQDSLTAAHRYLPFGTEVLVTNLKNNKQVTVRINDRGPFAEGRIIDLSRTGAETLDYINDGLATVRIEAVLPESTADSLYQIIDSQ